MTSLILLSIGCLALALALHPFTSYPLSLLALKLLKPRSSTHRIALPTPSGAAAATATRFAICTCAYNEESVIEEKLHNLLSLREKHPSLEILVYVDAASDRTAEICQRYADRITLHASPDRHGKTHGMNLLVARTQADIVVFTDANVMLDAEVLDKLDAHFANPEIGCVCGNLIYTNSADSVTARSGSLYWRVEEWIKRLETDTGSVMGADGSLFAIRRSLHQPPPDHIIDDMYVSFMVLCGGHRVVQANDVRAYEETVPAMHEEFRRKVRIACQAFNVHRLIWPQLRRLDTLSLYKYVSHKLLRWFTIYLMGLAFLAFLAATLVAGWWTAAAALVAGAALIWLLGHLWPVQPFSQVFDILAAFSGVGVGVWRSVLGDVYQTWKPATSIRKT
jgi:cellulose synthase/poly-beta-1,6-N-acetylglucosamine synthase-like glycosyltransferase